MIPMRLLGPSEARIGSHPAANAVPGDRHRADPLACLRLAVTPIRPLATGERFMTYREVSLRSVLRRGRYPAMAACLLVGVSAPARAGYYVLTYAASNVPTAGVTYGYNAAGAATQLDTAANVGEGSTAAVNCVSNSGQTCAYTATQTNNDTTGTATSSINSTSVSVTTIPFFSYQTPQTFTASAFARANLSSGILGVSGTGNYGGFDSGEDQGGSGTGWAILSDTLHLTVAGANASTVTTFGVSFTVKGGLTVLSGAPSDGGAAGSVGTSLQFGNGAESTNLAYAGNGNPQETFTESTPTGWVSYTETPSSDGNYTFTGEYSIVGASAIIPIVASMTAYACQLEADCNFADTGQVSLDLPGDVTYTSDSGVFLNNPGAGDTGQSVPEPSSLVVLIGGLGLLTVRGRDLLRRRSGGLAAHH